MADLRTLEDDLKAAGTEPAERYWCTLPTCRRYQPAFALVSGRSIGHAGYVCGDHLTDAVREETAAVEALERETVVDWSYALHRRDVAVNALLWAVADGTPLTPHCAALHEDRIRALHRMRLEHDTPEAALAWLEALEPIPLDYPETGG